MRKLIFAIVASFALANTNQVVLKKGMWSLVGVNGYHSANKNSSPQSGWYTLRTTYTNGTTCDMLDLNSHHNNSPSGGEAIASTLCIKSLSDDIQDLSINYDLLDKNHSQSMHTMFASFGVHNANIKITYQSDYEGKKFYITPNNSYAYEGVFSIHNTRAQNLRLTKHKRNVSDEAKRIVDIVDSNLTDNNISNLSQIRLNIDTVLYGQSGGRQPLSGDDNLTMYSWDQGTTRWLTFMNKNAPIHNTFDSLEKGRAYWSRIDGAKSDEMGLLLADDGVSKKTFQDANLKDGWNLVSFNDSSLRDIASAVLVAQSDIGSGLIIRDSFKDGNITVPSMPSLKDFASFVNNASVVRKKQGKFLQDLRAYVVQDSTNTDFVMIISNDSFDVDKNFKTVLLNNLHDYSYDGNLSSRKDEFMLSLKLNGEFFPLANKQIFLDLGAPSVQNATFRIDLSGANTKADALAMISNAIGTKAKAYLLDTNFDDDFDSILIVMNERFYAKEASHTKAYAFNPQGSHTFNIQYLHELTHPITSASTIDATINAINAEFSTTNVRAFRSSANTILLQSQNDIYIVEDDESNEFAITNENNESMKGGFTDLVQGVDLASADLNLSSIDESFVDVWNASLAQSRKIGYVKSCLVGTTDLGQTAVFVNDFSYDSPLYLLTNLGTNRRILNILSPVTRTNGTILWRQADFSIRGDLWKEDEAKFNLFRFSKSRGYWVRLASNALANPLQISDPKYTTTISREFDNNFSSSDIGSVRNNQKVTIDVNIKGLDNRNIYAKPGEMLENVDLIIGGQRMSMMKNGSSFNYMLALNDYYDTFLRQRTTPPEQKTKLIFFVADGLGNTAQKEVFFDNQRPSAPSYEFNNTAEYGAIDVYVPKGLSFIIYDGNLSDNHNEYDKRVTNSMDLASGIERINPLEAKTQAFDFSSKPVYDFRLIFKDKNNLWSDMRRVFYAPVFRNAHILESNETAGIDTLPIAFDGNGQNPEFFTQSGGRTNSGVSLQAQDTNPATNYSLSMSYVPIGGATLTCASPITTYVATSSATTVGVIQYCPSYANNFFYIYDKTNGGLYYEKFQTSSNTSGTPLRLIPIDSSQNFFKPPLI